MDFSVLSTHWNGCGKSEVQQWFMNLGVRDIIEFGVMFESMMILLEISICLVQ